MVFGGRLLVIIVSWCVFLYCGLVCLLLEGFIYVSFRLGLGLVDNGWVGSLVNRLCYLCSVLVVLNRLVGLLLLWFI